MGAYLMEESVESKDHPVLAEWRGTDEVGHLILTDEMSKYDVETQMGSLLGLAGFAIAMVLAAAPRSDREEISHRLVEDAQALANGVLDTDLAAVGVVQ